MIVTRNASVGNRMRALRNQGRHETGDWFQHSELGYNYRLSEISSALGIEQLRRIESILTVRAGIARAYHERLQSEPLILPPIGLPHARISWFVYVVRLRSGFNQLHRDAILKSLTSQGIGCGRYFAPIHRHPAYADWNDLRLPITESEAARAIALPFFNRITEEQLDRVCAALSSALRSASKFWRVYSARSGRPAKTTLRQTQAQSTPRRKT